MVRAPGFASPRVVLNYQRTTGWAVSVPLECGKGTELQLGLFRFSMRPDVCDSFRRFEKRNRPSRPCYARCPSVPSSHSKGGHAMALHHTLRGRIKTVAPIEADCVASPIARRTSGFFARDRSGESTPGQAGTCPRPVCPLPLADKRRRRPQILPEVEELRSQPTILKPWLGPYSPLAFSRSTLQLLDSLTSRRFWHRPFFS